MKNLNSKKTIRMIEKFDQQLRDILNEELKSVRAVKNQIVALANMIPEDDGLLVA